MLSSDPRAVQAQREEEKPDPVPRGSMTWNENKVGELRHSGPDYILLQGGTGVPSEALDRTCLK